ncbi:HAD family hydrolase [Microbacterium sp. R86528]|uniref:HAD family hydrolase n=1 Tax=Microbacterium sp. R86528 TaxID=3093864 RepID=UPI0037C99DED
MSHAQLPPIGEVEVAAPAEAAEKVEQAAHDAEDPRVAAMPLLIALDLDGTVLLEDETLSSGVFDAVAEAREAGHEVMVATGRSWEGTADVLALLQIAPEFVVCSNGAVVLKRVSIEPLEYERFKVETFDATDVLQLLRAQLPDAHYLVELADGARRYTDFLPDWKLERTEKVLFEELATDHVCRVVVVAPDQHEKDFSAIVESIGLHHVSYAVGFTAWLDIAPKDIDKGTGLELVRTELGIAPDHVMVIGDGRNDLGMFRWALQNGGRAVAMRQAPQEVLDAAGEMTLSVEEGGVAAILRSL